MRKIKKLKPSEISAIISPSLSKKEIKKVNKGSEGTIRKKYKYMELPPFECDRGWNKLIDNLFETIAVADKNKLIRVEQIKEKYATLRVHIKHIDDPIVSRAYRIIARFEKASAKTCEVCGNEGHIVVMEDFTWYKTLCERHTKKLGYIEIRKAKIKKRISIEKEESSTPDAYKGNDVS